MVGSDAPAVTRSLLLVEDDPFSRGLLEQTFRASGFEVVAAANAVEAVRLFEEADPDALVVDVNLGPGADGLELANALRSQAPYLAVLVLTRFPSPAVAGMRDRTPPHAAFLSKDAAEDPRMIVVVAEYFISPGNEQRVEELVTMWAHMARAEEGNRAFIVNRSVDDPRHLMLYEQYVDQAAFEFHANRPEFKAVVLDQIVPLLERRVRHMYELVV